MTDTNKKQISTTDKAVRTILKEMKASFKGYYEAYKRGDGLEETCIEVAQHWGELYGMLLALHAIGYIKGDRPIGAGQDDRDGETLEQAWRRWKRDLLITK